MLKNSSELLNNSSYNIKFNCKQVDIISRFTFVRFNSESKLQLFNIDLN